MVQSISTKYYVIIQQIYKEVRKINPNLAKNYVTKSRRKILEFLQ